MNSNDKPGEGVLSASPQIIWGAVLTDQQDPQVGDGGNVVSETLSSSVSTLCRVFFSEMGCYWSQYGFRNHLQSGYI